MNDRKAMLGLPEEWTALAGPVLGLSQQALVGFVRAIVPDGYDRTALDSLFSELLGELGPNIPRGESPEAELVSHAVAWAGAIQRQYNIAVSEHFTIEMDGRPGVDGSKWFQVHMPYLAKDAALVALRWIAEIVREHIATGVPFENREAFARKQDQLARALAPFQASINAFRFLRAADRLRIPVDAMTPTLIQFGIGRGSRMMIGSYIDTTSVIAAQIADNKLATAIVLRRAGLPGAVHLPAPNPAAAAKAARRIGYPVVVKPADRDQGLGVAAGLTSEGAVRAAFLHAAKLSSSILVERHFEGLDYRLTVFDGRVLQVIHRRPGGVTGDGSSSLANLVERESAKPENVRREREFGRKLLDLDAEALDLASEQSLGTESIVPAGRFVPLRRRANVSSGGTPINIPSSQVHPDNLDLAVRAAEALRLNLAGVDLIVPDIARSWHETGGLICEVNGQPQISRTGSPTIHEDILRSILRRGFRPPIVVCVSRDTSPPPRALAAERGVIGASGVAGIWLNGTAISGRQANGFAAARALFANQTFDTAVVHLTPAEILERGLPFQDCDAAVIAADSLDNEQALRWLTPHVVGDIFLPHRHDASAMPRTGPSASRAPVSYHNDPWDVAADLARRHVADACQNSTGADL